MGTMVGAGDTRPLGARGPQAELHERVDPMTHTQRLCAAWVVALVGLGTLVGVTRSDGSHTSAARAASPVEYEEQPIRLETVTHSSDRRVFGKWRFWEPVGSVDALIEHLGPDPWTNENVRSAHARWTPVVRAATDAATWKAAVDGFGEEVATMLRPAELTILGGLFLGTTFGALPEWCEYKVSQIQIWLSKPKK